MYLLAIMLMLTPARKSKIFFICIILNLAPVNPQLQHQNYAEHCIGHIKDVTSHVLTFTGAPNKNWLLCLMDVVYTLNISTSIYVVKHLIFLPCFVSDSMN